MLLSLIQKSNNPNGNDDNIIMQTVQKKFPKSQVMDTLAMINTNIPKINKLNGNDFKLISWLINLIN